MHQGSKHDAKVFACGANKLHGLQRTNADKRRCVELILRLEPTWSSRQVAKHVGVSHWLISSVRSDNPDLAKQPTGDEVDAEGIKAWLVEHPEWSDRRIAHKFKVDHTTVGRYRAQLDGGDQVVGGGDSSTSTTPPPGEPEDGPSCNFAGGEDDPPLDWEELDHDATLSANGGCDEEEGPGDEGRQEAGEGECRSSSPAEPPSPREAKPPKNGAPAFGPPDRKKFRAAIGQAVRLTHRLPDYEQRFGRHFDALLEELGDA